MKTDICPCGCSRPIFVEVEIDNQYDLTIPDYIEITCFDDMNRGVRSFVLGLHE